MKGTFFNESNPLTVKIKGKKVFDFLIQLLFLVKGSYLILPYGLSGVGTCNVHAW